MGVTSQILGQLSENIIRAFNTHAIDVCGPDIGVTLDLMADFRDKRAFSRPWRPTHIQTATRPSMNATLDERVEFSSLLFSSNQAPWICASQEELTSLMENRRGTTDCQGRAWCSQRRQRFANQTNPMARGNRYLLGKGVPVSRCFGRSKLDRFLKFTWKVLEKFMVGGNIFTYLWLTLRS